MWIYFRRGKFGSGIYQQAPRQKPSVKTFFRVPFVILAAKNPCKNSEIPLELAAFKNGESDVQLTSKQKKFLKGLAHDLQPVVYIGQNGVSDTVLMEIDRTLDSHELIKIRIRCDDHHEMKALTEEIENQSHGNLVQIIGHTMVLYRRAKEPQIVLPR